MKEIGIIMSPPMVAATLEDRKTVTRRLNGLGKINANPGGYYFQSLVQHATGKYTFGPVDITEPTDADIIEVKCPYGKPGDLLYVRENWQLRNWSFEDQTITIRYADGVEIEHEINAEHTDIRKHIDWLTNQVKQLERDGIIIDHGENVSYEFTGKKQPFKPSIHLPKYASRIWLRNEAVNVEGLHNINGRDILKEGVDNGKSNPAMGVRWENMQRMAFEELWNKINGNWNANPWVWVVKYKVLSKTGRPSPAPALPKGEGESED